MILLSSLLFGSYGVWSLLMGDKFGVFYQGWVRSVIVLLLLIPLVLITKSYKPVERSDIKWLLLPVLFGIATQAPLYYAFNHTSIGTATLLFYGMYIIASFLTGRLIMKEPITLTKLTAMLLSFIGLAFVFQVSLATFSLLALALAGINGIASGVEVSSTQKSTLTYPTLQVTTYAWIGILVTHLPLSLLTDEKQWIPALSIQWYAMGAYALAGMLAFYLVVEGFKYVDASIGSLIGLLEVIWGILFGVWFFHEHAGLSVLVGSIFILTAGFLPDIVNLLNYRKHKPAVEHVLEHTTI